MERCTEKSAFSFVWNKHSWGGAYYTKISQNTANKIVLEIKQDADFLATDFWT